jgi:threonine dehydrogenase-like Zn-dependent dehydrogenase
VKPRGTLVLKSTVTEIPSIDLAPVVVGEIRVIGSRCGPFPPALRALETGSIDVHSLVCDRIPLRDAAEALRRADAPGALKVLVET